MWANGSNYTQIFLTHVLLVCEICSCLGPTIGNDGEGNSTLLQYSCLENPRDGGAWWAAVCGVAQSWPRLKWLSSRHRKWASADFEICCESWNQSPSDTKEGGDIISLYFLEFYINGIVDYMFPFCLWLRIVILRFSMLWDQSFIHSDNCITSHCMSMPSFLSGFLAAHPITCLFLCNVYFIHWNP